ncbi:MAG: HIT family protein [Saprospiraceae bacterium]|jgi:diadenosine tetraphosphate (Ap4A) HIT family hydrolase
MSAFKDIEKSRILYSSSYFMLIWDAYPVSPGHMLIVSINEKIDYFELSDHEKNDLTKMIDKAQTIINEKYSPDGFNIGMNCGTSAGQTVMHFHCHVIPRYDGDVEDPRGGIRHCIPGKGYY